jgi:hypothetical protein
MRMTQPVIVANATEHGRCRAFNIGSLAHYFRGPSLARLRNHRSEPMSACVLSGSERTVQFLWTDAAGTKADRHPCVGRPAPRVFNAHPHPIQQDPCQFRARFLSAGIDPIHSHPRLGRRFSRPNAVRTLRSRAPRGQLPNIASRSCKKSITARGPKYSGFRSDGLIQLYFHKKAILVYRTDYITGLYERSGCFHVRQAVSSKRPGSRQRRVVDRARGVRWIAAPAVAAGHARVTQITGPLSRQPARAQSPR